MTIYKPKASNLLLDGFGIGDFFRCKGLLFASCTLLFLGCGGEADSPIDKALESEHSLEREDALNKLQDSDNKEDAYKAVKHLKDADSNVRKTAINLIVKLEHNTTEVLEILGAMIAGDEDKSVRTSALHALLDLGAHNEFVEHCKNALAGSEHGMRMAACMYLGEAGEHAAAAQKELVAGLRDSDSGIKMGCIIALGNLGSKASGETKAALKAAAKDADKNISKIAKDALKKLK